MTELAAYTETDFFTAETHPEAAEQYRTLLRLRYALLFTQFNQATERSERSDDCPTRVILLQRKNYEQRGWDVETEVSIMSDRIIHQRFYQKDDRAFFHITDYDTLTGMMKGLNSATDVRPPYDWRDDGYQFEVKTLGAGYHGGTDGIALGRVIDDVRDMVDRPHQCTQFYR